MKDSTILIPVEKETVLFLFLFFEEGNRLKSEGKVDKIIRLRRNYFDQTSLEN